MSESRENKVQSMLCQLPRFIWKYKFTVLSLMLVFFDAMVIAKSYNNKHWLILLSFYFLFCALSKCNLIIRLLATIVVSLLLTVDLYFVLVYGEKLSFAILDAIIDASPSEVSALLVSSLVQSIAVFGGIFSLFFLSQKELKEAKPGLKVSLFLFASYWFIFAPLYSYPILQKNKAEFDLGPAFTFYNSVSFRFPVIYRNLSLYATYKEQSVSVKDYKLATRTLPDQISFNPTSAPNKIYLIIDESVIRSHLSLYGYERQTTPFLDSLSLVNPNFKYYNGVACAPLTAMVIPMALSLGGPMDNDATFKYKNLLEMMQDAGYETTWLSTHSVFGTADTKISVFASVAQNVYYADKYPPDNIKLLDEFEKRLDNNKKQFIVLHIDGSHFEYKHRYNQVDAVALSGEGHTTDYDRTIHATDRFFRKYYNILDKQNEPYAMLYFPDHGEIIGKGHGFVEGGVEQFEIPFISLNKDVAILDSLVHKYQNIETSFISNSNAIYMITELVGYKYSEERIARVVEETSLIKHADANIYRYEDLQKGELKVHVRGTSF